MRIHIKKILSGVLAAALLAGSLPDFQANAVETARQEELPAEENPADLAEGTGDGADIGTDYGGQLDGSGGQSVYQYVTFPDSGGDIIITVPDAVGVSPLKNVAADTVWRIDVKEREEFVFEAAVRYGYRLAIPDALADLLAERQDRELADGRWVYRYGLKLSELSTAKTEPLSIEFASERDVVPVAVKGDAAVSGVDGDGMAQLGSRVSIEVEVPGMVLARVTCDEKGSAVYTAMELDYHNRYTFTVEEQADFVVVDPEQADFAIAYGAERKAKRSGEAGLKLTGLSSSAQGYKEIVLNLTAVKNGSDGTEKQDVYYEVKVTAVPREGEVIPAGSAEEPVYYYIPKKAGTNTQSKSVQVNAGDLSAPTACLYEFSVRMVLINRTQEIPDEDTPAGEPLEAALSGNTITKSFATRNLYYEDKLGFTKKKTTIYSGQKDVLAGTVKYSKKASYLHDLTAVAYDSRGAVCAGLTCTFRNDNDELYLSAASNVLPGKYKVVVYAGVGEDSSSGSPQGGTLYQANTSFTLTVQAGIWYIDTTAITTQAAVNNKNITFNAAPVGRGYYDNKKTKSQKFSYEIKSAVLNGTELSATEPTENVKNNISVNKSGKVTVKKGFYVDPDTAKNYIAIVIKAADFAGNEATATAYVQIVNTARVPAYIRIGDGHGNWLKAGNKYELTAADAENTVIVVQDKDGNVINDYVTITPADNSKNTAAAYISRSKGTDYLHVRKCTTITIKATPKDGGKKSKSVKLTITEPKVTSISYYLADLTSDGFQVDSYTVKGGTIRYSAPQGAVFKLRMGVNVKGTRYFNNWFDMGYTMKNGKVKKDGDYILVTPTAKDAELTVQTGSISGTLTFTNVGWNKKYDAPPGLKLIDGKLYSNRYTSRSELVPKDGKYYVPTQTLTYQYDHGSYDEIMIARISKSGPDLYLSDFDPAERTFVLNTEAGNDLKTGSFQYRIAFMRDGELMCRPAAITVKVNKGASLKITSSYTLDIQKSEYITLKATPAEFIPDYDTQLLNANVGGKANDFDEYFEMEYLADAETGEPKVVLRFKDSVMPDERMRLRGRSFTGYVKYSYYYGYSYIENATAKVTIRIK